MGRPWCTRGGGGALAELLRDGARLPVRGISAGGGSHRSRRGSPGCRSQVWGGGHQLGPSPQGQHRPPCGLFPALGAAGGWRARSWVGARRPSRPLARPCGSRHCRRSIARAKCPGSRSENNEEIQSARGLLRRHRLRGKPGPGSSPANAGVRAPAPRPARPRPLRPGGGDGGLLQGPAPSARPMLLQPSPAQDVPHAEAVRPAAACVGHPAASCPPRPPSPCAGLGRAAPSPDCCLSSGPLLGCSPPAPPAAASCAAIAGMGAVPPARCSSPVCRGARSCIPAPAAVVLPLLWPQRGRGSPRVPLGGCGAGLVLAGSPIPPYLPRLASAVT